MSKQIFRAPALAVVLGFQLWALAMPVAMAQTAAQKRMFQSLPLAQQQQLLGQLARANQQTGQSAEAVAAQAPPKLLQPDQQDIEARAKRSQSRLAKSDELKPFGYDLFQGQPTTFAPVSDVPVPTDYTLGPGDRLRLTLFGKESGEYELRVDRSGSVFIPELGPISIAGLQFSEARAQIQARVREGKIGVNASVQMGELRSIRIFVAGDARYPGSYTVSSLATMIQALYVSGGVKEIGSLRSIQLRRNGANISTLDLYDLLLRGDARNDERLRAGDVVFVPPVGATVTVKGAVRRPAIYELSQGAGIDQVIELAGGIVPGAVMDRVSVERVKNGRRTLVQTMLHGAGEKLRLRGGDVLEIHTPLEQADDAIRLEGPARWPGQYAVDSRTQFTSIIRSPLDLDLLSDLDFALIMRRADEGAGLLPVYLNPRRAFAGDAEADVRMQAGDVLYLFSNVRDENGREDDSADDRPDVRRTERRTAESLGLDGEAITPGGRSDQRNVFQLSERLGSGDSQIQQDENAEPRPQESESTQASNSSVAPASAEPAFEPELPGRTERMAALVAELESLARYGAPAPIVEVVGAVRFPGRLPLDPITSTVMDVVRAAGGFLDTADVAFVDITRAPKSPAEGLAAERVIVRTDAAAMTTLRVYPGDVLSVRSKPGADDQRMVTILGEVVYPGSYHMETGATLGQLVQRAGGLTQEGFARGAVFTRAELQRKEQYQVDRLKERLRGDLAAASLTKAASGTGSLGSMQTLEGLFGELAQYEALGRLVIDLPAQIAGTGNAITLEDGDTLIVPKTPEEVTVLGEVQFPTSHRWEEGLRREAYIGRSGGYTQLADEKRAFVVRADGSVVTARGFLGRGPVLEAGDVVVVPLDATPIEPLTLFSSVTQIIYQLALTVAAFNSVGAF